VEKSLTANPAAGAGCGAAVKVHSEAGVCVELPARSCGHLESRFADSALYGRMDLRSAASFPERRTLAWSNDS
jgi:hypothetical protein